MQKICILCNREYEVGNMQVQGPEPGQENLCVACRTNICAAKKFTLAEYLETLPVPVFSVNADGIIELANRSAAGYFGKDVQRMQGARGGDVFECAYARLPGGCGKTIHCSACAVRRAVMHTFETGESLYRQPACINRIKSEVPEKINFYVTTIKYNQFVVLSIEGPEN
jgi:PAS domain-containing protein